MPSQTGPPSKKSTPVFRYVLVVVTLVTVGAMSFAFASQVPPMLYVGITFMIFAVIAVIICIVKACHYRCSCACCCSNDDEESGFSCCCLATEEEPRTVQQIISALRSENNEVQSETINGSEIVVTPPEETTADKVTHLETEINRLRQQYEFLKRQECVDEIIEQDFATLENEEAKLNLWKGDVVPTDVQLKSMKGRLKRVARNFRLTRLRIYNQEHADQPNALNGVPCEIDMDAPEQVRIFATDVPIPPAYTELDPERPAYSLVDPQQRVQQQSDASTSSFVGMQRQNSQVPLIDNMSRTDSFVLPSPNSRTDFVLPSPNGAYNNIAFQRHLSDSSGFLAAPPEDERGAPPAYEEAAAVHM